MDKIRKIRKEYQSWGKGYYHLSTDGWKDGKLFYTEEQYAHGMTLTGLLSLRFALTIYDFALMDNHVHLLLSGAGTESVRAFDYLRHKISARLVKDGFPPLPKDYFFKLTPIKDEEQMRVNYLYIDRNILERGVSLPGGYPWGAAYLHHSQWGKYLSGEPAGSFRRYSELERMMSSRTPIPPTWRFHRKLGLLPDSFINEALFHRLFPNPKTYQTRLVKEYEAFVKLGKSIEEGLVFSEDEIRDIVYQHVQTSFPGKSLRLLSNEEKGRLCVKLNDLFQFSSWQLANALNMSEHLVKQFLASKDFGKRSSGTSRYEIMAKNRNAGAFRPSHYEK